jgi:hypothetical protein
VRRENARKRTDVRRAKWRLPLATELWPPNRVSVIAAAARTRAASAIRSLNHR